MLNALIDACLSEDEASSNRGKNKLKELLNIDDINLTYFLLLAEKRKRLASNKMIIVDSNLKIPPHTIAFYSTANAPKELLKNLNLTHYDSLLNQTKEFTAIARNVHVIRAPMHAGTGSSFARKAYLADILKIPEHKISVGAKGGDLFISVPTPLNPNESSLISLIEVQILQAIYEAKNQTYKKISIKTIVSAETQKSLIEIMNKPALTNPELSYKKLFEQNERLAFLDESFQAKMPTINEKGDFNTTLTAPAGHGFFAVEILEKAARKTYLQEDSEEIYRISNGEDLNSCENPLIIGYMIKKQIPIIIVTTTRQEADVKGGTIGLAISKDQKPYATIFEKAQAEQAEKIIPNQKELFEKLGLQKRGDKAFFNTNMVLFNLKILSPKLKKLLSDLGRSEYLRTICPDCFLSEKKQIDPDGIERKYEQLEGVLSSSILNLDKIYRNKYNESLVHFINVDLNYRTEFFSPIKIPIDFIEKFLSKRFTLGENYRLIDRKPGTLLKIKLLDPDSNDNFWQDLSNALHSLNNVNFLELDELTIIGKIVISNTIFKGTIFIKNHSKELFDLTKYFYNNQFTEVLVKDYLISLENVKIEISKTHTVTIGTN